MSTLPRLPAKFRGLTNGNGVPILSTSQLANKSPYFQSSRQTNSSLSSPNNSAHSHKSTSVNHQLQGIRDAALKKYEAYNSQLRQMERNFQLDIKKSEQQSTRNLSKLIDLISSLSSEMFQLNNQSNLLKNKIDFLRNKLIETQSSGTETFLSPLKNGFDAFGQEFEEALRNINTLFSNLDNRVKMVQKDFDIIKFINSEITNINELITDLQKGLQDNSSQLLYIRDELDETLNCQQVNTTKRLQDRMSTLRSRIDNLEQDAFQSLNKSQNVIADSQTAQYEMRELFNNSMNVITSSFKSKINESKKSLFDLQQTRFEQIDTIHSRLSKTSESIAKMRKKKLKNVSQNQSSKNQSLQPEIDKLTKKVEDLENQLNRKMTSRKSQTKKSDSKSKKNKNAPNKGVRIFYNIQENNNIEIIIVDEDGNVI
ncbi:hypothetical protein M9Y10_035624 [Tritrichomonas musculus]|uniref:Uncharacterized protein n=1 Tax=Tritrichomonas musculus TaxID=1915356 RepID=A0ABR2GWB4_9EUKA